MVNLAFLLLFIAFVSQNAHADIDGVNSGNDNRLYSSRINAKNFDSEAEENQNNRNHHHDHEKSLSHDHEADHEKPSDKQIKMGKENFLKKCRKKDSHACYSLGVFYRSVEKNKKQELNFFKRACGMKHSEACYFYALSLYKLNKGASKRILINECVKGSSKSCRRVGGYLKTEKNRSGAKKYLNIACEKGDSSSCHDIAMLETDKNIMVKKLNENCYSRGHSLSCRFLSVLKN